VNKLFGAVFAVFLGLAISIPDAEAAKRLGGGKSMGQQRQSTQQKAEPRQTQAPQAAPAAGAAGAGAAAGGSRWLGPVAGLMAGGLLGAMFFGGAFDGIKFMDILLILLLVGGVFFIFKMMRKPQADTRRNEPLRYAGVGADPRVEQQPMPQALGGATASAAAAQPVGGYFPPGFDAEGFARGAKSNFMRLQEANDRGDVQGLRDMMTPALFQEVEAEMRGRNNAPQKTEVLTLDAKVVEVVTEGDHYIASVRFTGLIRDDGATQPESFSEVWHLQKPLNGKSGWLVGGIQQD
jgi:predicted lipid-binding transport protein (Tim44 family)